MLNSAYIIFPAAVSLDKLKDALIKSGVRAVEEEKLKWIATIHPDRHVRLNSANIN